MFSNYNEVIFRGAVDKALEEVKTILGTAKNPRLAADEDHTYEDKYALAEFVTNSSIASLLHVLDRLGLDAEKLQTLLKWVVDDKKNVTLSFRAEDSCSFIQETLVDQTSPSEFQIETTEISQTSGGAETTTTTKTGSARVIRKVRLCHWKVGVNYAIAAYPGNDTASAVEIQARSTSTVIITSAGMASDYPRTTPKSPIPEYTVHNPIEVNITWLLQNLNREAGVCQFSIDRDLPSCKTPRRNEQVDAALKFGESFGSWTYQVVAFYDSRIENEILSKHNPLHEPTVGENSLANGTSGDAIRSLIVPVMENGGVLTPADTGALLDAHSQSINATCCMVAQMFPSSQLAKLATTAEATIVLLCNHARHLLEQYHKSINYIEDMLRKQLIQAIGKQISANDFEKFMRFHNQKLFGPLFAPKPFTHAIRRPNHCPDGILSIESDIDTSNNYIETMVRHVPGKDNPSIFIPINAATSLEITGDRFLHGWIQFQFAERSPNYKLVARARQFSSFLLIIGTMAGKDKFSPKHAIILQNKDEVLIPLLTEVLPTAKEFKDAIASLSPEQQDFAKAYRGMQLESSVFGVCVIQIKPQLEKLLGLPPGALTKEIQLTQDLMSLFVDYQIPSDLLSFDGDVAADMTTKLTAVKGHVKAVTNVIDGAKEKQLLEQERKSEMRDLQSATFGSASVYERHRAPQMRAMAVAPSGGAMPMKCFAAPVTSPGGAMLFGSPPTAPSGGFGSPVPAPSPGGFGSAPFSAVPASDTAQPVAEKPEAGREESMGDDDFEMADDFTLIPKVLDTKVEKLDADSSLKSTIIKAGEGWTRSRQENLLTKLESSTLSSDAVEKEKNNAFDMLDAISCSGTLPIDCAELHVIVALSHCFENDVMGTIIQDNINPIEKVERSSLIVASTIHDEDCQLLLHGSANINRLGARFPALFMEED